MGKTPNNFQKRTLAFSILLCRTTSRLRQFGIEYVITQQLIRSATSISANIWEAQGARSRRDFLNYFHIALKSAHETDHWLLLCQQLISDQSILRPLLDELDQLTKIIGQSLLTMKRRV